MIILTFNLKKILKTLSITAIIAVMLSFTLIFFVSPSTLGLNIAGYEFPFDDAENKHFVLATAAEEIKWVDFNIPYEALRKAMQLEINARREGCEAVNWIEMLSYLACKYWGNWANYREADLVALAERLKNGEEMRQIVEGQEQFAYHMRRYGAILGGFLGEREDGEHGLLVYFPIAAGYRFSHSDDFGHSRSYGYDRRHLGHDIMASVGTPVIAIESGIVEVMGWNQ
ncbi:MAG: M23 family metallopeptidase [Oscillospiraceae bacterium]|nr:M23 family metallopeptidase [Oscillospiraceae bacterium]